MVAPGHKLILLSIFNMSEQAEREISGEMG